MKDNPIHVRIVSLPISMLDYSFSVQVVSPVILPERIFTVTCAEVLAQSTREATKRVIEKLLSQRILGAYNKFIEDAPLMDMIEDPERYALATRVYLNMPSLWNGQESTP